MATMKDAQRLIKQAIQGQLDAGKTQLEVAHDCEISPATIYKYLNGNPRPDVSTLKKFSRGLNIPIEALLVADGAPPYKLESAQIGPVSSKTARLNQIAERLDGEALATLERCAEAFAAADPDIRLHLIGQLKLIEKLVKGKTPPPSRSGTGQKAGGGRPA